MTFSNTVGAQGGRYYEPIISRQRAGIAKDHYDFCNRGEKHTRGKNGGLRVCVSIWQIDLRDELKTATWDHIFATVNIILSSRIYSCFFQLTKGSLKHGREMITQRSPTPFNLLWNTAVFKHYCTSFMTDYKIFWQWKCWVRYILPTWSPKDAKKCL